MLIVWVKRLSILVAGLLLGIFLVSTAAVLILDEADYKRLLSWGAEQFLDSQLVIEGPLDIDISRNLSLASGGITLKANDASYQLSAGQLHASFRLGSYLTTGTFWFNSLELTDVRLEVMESTDDDFALEDIYIPPVVFEQAQVNNLVFSYQELPPGTLHTFALTELSLGELGEQQPVSLRATGLFEGQPVGRAIAALAGGAPQQQDVDAAVGDCVVAQRTADRAGDVLGVPGLEPGANAGFQLRDDLLGNLIVEVVEVGHDVAPVRWFGFLVKGGGRPPPVSSGCLLLGWQQDDLAVDRQGMEPEAVAALAVRPGGPDLVEEALAVGFGHREGMQGWLAVGVAHLFSPV